MKILSLIAELFYLKDRGHIYNRHTSHIEATVLRTWPKNNENRFTEGDLPSKNNMET